METPELTKEQKKKAENARRNRERRARVGHTINEAKREKRKELKAITSIPIAIETPTLKKAKKLPPASTAVKQEITKTNYASAIKSFYKKYTGKELNEDAEILKKINEQPYKALIISKEFKPIITQNIKEILTIPHQVKALYAVFRGIRGFDAIEKTLLPYDKEYQRQYEEKRSQVIATDEDLNRIDFSNLEEYEANLAKLDDIIDKIIYSFSMIVRGRVSDLRNTKKTTNKKDITDDNFNWYYQGKLYINNTKNKKQYIIELPELLNYWNELPNGYILGGLINQSTLSQRIQRVFLKLYGKIYTASNLRHLYATAINNSGASLEERQKTAKQSGHSITEQLKYVYKPQIAK
jgi:hypothetical protein